MSESKPRKDDSLERRKDGRTVVAGALASVVFGPVSSRRYGRALGINLLPSGEKICNFNCPYCECGFTDSHLSMPPLDPSRFPKRTHVRDCVEQALQKIAEVENIPDIIMQAGNGEPTLHPEFAEITGDLRELRDRYIPGTPLGLLSNGGTIRLPEVRNAVLLYEVRVLKLDCGTEEMFRKISNPLDRHTLEDHVRILKEFRPFTLQAMFLHGRLENTTKPEVDAWLERLREIRPEKVHIYSLDRKPADPNLLQVPKETLERIAQRVRNEVNLPCEVF